MLITRRGLLGGFAALLAAPAIVRVASLMPVRAAYAERSILDLLERRIAQAEMVIRDNFTAILYGDGPPGWSAGLATLIPLEDADYSFREVSGRFLWNTAGATR